VPNQAVFIADLRVRWLKIEYFAGQSIANQPCHGKLDPLPPWISRLASIPSWSAAADLAAEAACEMGDHGHTGPILDYATWRSGLLEPLAPHLNGSI